MKIITKKNYQKIREELVLSVKLPLTEVGGFPAYPPSSRLRRTTEGYQPSRETGRSSMHSSTDRVGGFLRRLVKDGKILVLPFDTVYGLVADPFNDRAIDRIYKIKGRDFNKPIALVFSSVEMLTKYISISSDRQKFIQEKVPGTYTFILPWPEHDRRKFSLPYQKLEKIGIRIPNFQFILDFIALIDQPIAATSANISGQANCWSVGEFLGQISGQKEKPDFIIDAGTLVKNPPSEIIDISNINQTNILRK